MTLQKLNLISTYSKIIAMTIGSILIAIRLFTNISERILLIILIIDMVIYVIEEIINISLIRKICKKTDKK